MPLIPQSRFYSGKCHSSLCSDQKNRTQVKKKKDLDCTAHHVPCAQVMVPSKGIFPFSARRAISKKKFLSTTSSKFMHLYQLKPTPNSNYNYSLCCNFVFPSKWAPEIHEGKCRVRYWQLIAERPTVSDTSAEINVFLLTHFQGRK